MEFWINNLNGLKLNQYGIKMNNKAEEISKNLMCSINYVTADKIAYGNFNLRRQESWDSQIFLQLLVSAWKSFCKMYSVPQRHGF